LTLVHKNATDGALAVLGLDFDEEVECFVEGQCVTRDSQSRGNFSDPIAIVDDGGQQDDLHPLFFVVVGGL
jgi:hypothetical protein